MARMTRERRARRYLQASMESGYTGLPAEHKHAKQQLMREHERAYPRVRQHALAGTSRDFDRPLSAGEREHQSHLREQEGLTEHDVRAIREELRAKPERNPALSAGPKAAAAAGAAGTGVLDAAITGKGSLWLQIAGLFVGLALVYLLVYGHKGNGPKVLVGLANILTGATRTFIAPVDPIAKLESALGATPITTSTSAASGASTGGSGSAPNAGSPASVTGSPSAASYSRGSSVGGSGPRSWLAHLPPKPSKIKVKVSTPAEVRAFEKATGIHFAHGAG
jgi:hypothetical protein